MEPRQPNIIRRRERTHFKRYDFWPLTRLLRALAYSQNRSKQKHEQELLRVHARSYISLTSVLPFENWAHDTHWTQTFLSWRNGNIAFACLENKFDFVYGETVDIHYGRAFLLFIYLFIYLFIHFCCCFFFL